MAVFLITYDLNQEADRPDITGLLRDTFDEWARLSESSYAVESALDAGDIYSIFEPVLDSNDQLYVIQLKLPFSGLGPQEVNDWLQQRLTF